MTTDDKIIYGQYGPGDIESIIAEIEADTLSAKQRLSKLKREALDFHGSLPHPYNVSKTDLNPSPQGPAPTAAVKPLQGKIDQEDK